MYAITGDSIALGLSSYLHPAAIVAKVGIGSSPGARRTAALGESRLVVSLGTNDDPSNVREFQESMRTVLHGRECVVWLTVRGHRGFDQVLAAEAKRNKHLRVVGAVETVPTVDGIHPSPAGYRTIARRVRKALRGC